MRRIALAVTALALPLSLAAPASAGDLRDACWVYGPTFYLSGIICRIVPAEDPWPL